MSWPRSVLDAPVLRGLDERGRDAVVAAGRLLELARGAHVYADGDAGDSFFVVADGEIEIAAVRRGDETAGVVRTARRGETFGEEAVLGATRRATARASAAAVVAEVPLAVLRRAAGRVGSDAVEREERALRRAATLDLLRASAFTRDLGEVDLELVLDAARWQPLARAELLYAAGDPSDTFYLIADGLLQLQTEADGRVQVRAYLGRGDFFGDDELLAGEPRHTAAVAMGECRVLGVPARVLRTLADRNPELLPRLRRIARDRHAAQESVVGAAAARTTRHVFHDLYRMQMARSLLAIDLDSCVRCGHCAWSCADLHGTSRLVRRGDKVMTRLGAAGSEPRALLLPNSCQHCRNPVCMIDCPTGAIGRDPEGEVFIREELCTGCGACARACPWENVRMAPRGAARVAVRREREPPFSRHPDVAVKCDLCREWEAPACVSACPTEAIVRLDPSRDVAEVALLFGRTPASAVPAASRLWPAAALAAAVAVAVAGGAIGLDGGWSARTGPGRAAGWIAALGVLALAAHAVPKRFPRSWLRRRKPESHARRSAQGEPQPARAPRSRLRPLALAHAALGLGAMGAAAAHGGLRPPGGVAGGLWLAFWLSCLLGLTGQLAYRLVPARLTRLERSGLLPEDHAREKDALLDRLQRDASGRDELVKRILEKLLLPYVRAPLGPLWLLASGRSLAEEQAALERRVARVLEGRGGERLLGLSELIRTVVELRALPARRLLGALLRAWLPGHVVLAGVVIVLLAAHVVSVVRP